MLWEQGEPAGGFLRPMVVGTLKPSITFSSFPSLQLAPTPSQLPPSSLPGASHLVKLSLPDISKSDESNKIDVLSTQSSSHNIISTRHIDKV